MMTHKDVTGHIHTVVAIHPEWHHSKPMCLVMCNCTSIYRISSSLSYSWSWVWNLFDYSMRYLCVAWNVLNCVEGLFTCILLCFRTWYAMQHIPLVIRTLQYIFSKQCKKSWNILSFWAISLLYWLPTNQAIFSFDVK